MSVRVCAPVITGIRMLCIEFVEDIINFEINFCILINIVVHGCIPNKVGCCREESINSVCRLRSHTVNNTLTDQAGIKVLVIIIQANIPCAFRYIAVNILGIRNYWLKITPLNARHRLQPQYMVERQLHIMKKNCAGQPSIRKIWLKTVQA